MKTKLKICKNYYSPKSIFTYPALRISIAVLFNNATEMSFRSRKFLYRFVFLIYF